MIGFHDNLTQAGVVWEEGASIEKMLHQNGLGSSLWGHFLHYWLMREGPSPLWAVSGQGMCPPGWCKKAG